MASRRRRSPRRRSTSREPMPWRRSRPRRPSDTCTAGSPAKARSSCAESPGRARATSSREGGAAWRPSIRHFEAARPPDSPPTRRWSRSAGAISRKRARGARVSLPQTGGSPARSRRSRRSRGRGRAGGPVTRLQPARARRRADAKDAPCQRGSSAVPCPPPAQRLARRHQGGLLRGNAVRAAAIARAGPRGLASCRSTSPGMAQRRAGA
jgi:hypothetical protein